MTPPPVLPSLHPDGIGLLPLPGIPLVQPGDDVASLIAAATKAAGIVLVDGNVLVIAQKIVSKAEGRYVILDEVTPSAEARTLAVATAKDARLVEVILGESQRVLRHRPGVLIVVHQLGLVLANAGVDASNVDAVDGRERVLLLPVNPDASAAGLRAGLRDRLGVDVGVVITDSPGRAWRHGSVNIAIGVAGLPALVDLRGHPDLFGRPLRATLVGHADQIAAAAGLLQGQADEALPVVIVRGVATVGRHGSAADLIRAEAEDLFR